MSKSFSHAGVSKQDGEFKVRFANDALRTKVLVKNGHTDIDLVELPREMTKAEIAVHLVEIGFGKGNAAVEAAVAYVAKKNPAAKAPAVSKNTANKAETVTE